jgi:exonuclease VII small subunit
MAQPMEREVRRLQRAAKRLEIATKEWEEAYRMYAAALNELHRKTALKKGV